MTWRQHLMAWPLALLVLAAGYFAYDWRFWVRHFQSPTDDRIVFDFEWYEPKARVGEGPGRDVPIATETERTIDQAALDQVVATARELDSYAFIVARNGKIEAEYYKEGFGPESLFDTQSMHKGLLSVAFGVAVDKGIIPNLDLPAATYLPEWQNDARKAITIRQLLANTSGLAEPAFSEYPWSAAYRLFIGENVDATALSVPLADTPGEKFVFNHVNSQVLHAVLTRATKMTYADFLRENFWGPLGNGAAQVRLDQPGGSARTICCFQTTARSWFRLAQMLLDEGRVGEVRVVSADWIGELSTGTALNPKFGFHTLLGQPDPPRRRADPTSRVQPTKASEPFAAADVRYLEGRGGQRTMWIPSQKLVIIRIGRINFAWDDAKVINPLVAGIKN